MYNSNYSPIETNVTGRVIRFTPDSIEEILPLMYEYEDTTITDDCDIVNQSPKPLLEILAACCEVDSDEIDLIEAVCMAYNVGQIMGYLRSKTTQGDLLKTKPLVFTRPMHFSSQVDY